MDERGAWKSGRLSWNAQTRSDGSEIVFRNSLIIRILVQLSRIGVEHRRRIDGEMMIRSDR